MKPSNRATMAFYTRTAVSLHWLMAALVFAAVFMGWTMTEMAISPARLKTYNYHKWVGVTVLALALLRILWRLTHRAAATGEDATLAADWPHMPGMVCSTC